MCVVRLDVWLKSTFKPKIKSTYNLVWFGLDITKFKPNTINFCDLI